MKTTAAVLVETGKPLEIVELEIPALQPGQVLVEISYSGICHTQLLEAHGYRGEDKYLPHCLGHEGSGIVREVGPGIVKVSPGDRVILSWIKGSGANVPGTVYQWNGREVNAGGITTFSRYSVVSENRMTIMPDGFPMDTAALLGCAVPTGVGAVFNTARPSPGQSLAVFGTGGVGLCAVGGAVAAGCVPVIAIDVIETKLESAREMGATHMINADRTDPVEQVLNICPGRVDFAIEATGRPEVMLQAFHSVRNQGGAAVIVGNARWGEEIRLDPQFLNQGRSLLGTWGGDSVPDRDFPRYASLISNGRINTGPLMSGYYQLEEINRALDDLEAGRVIRPIVDMSLESG